jgi:hypothetical protein
LAYSLRAIYEYSSQPHAVPPVLLNWPQQPTVYPLKLDVPAIRTSLSGDRRFAGYPGHG